MACSSLDAGGPQLTQEMLLNIIKGRQGRGRNVYDTSRMCFNLRQHPCLELEQRLRHLGNHRFWVITNMFCFALSIVGVGW